MNTINEISLQNQQDFWSMLYIRLAASLRDVCGRRGAETLRRALRQMAEEEGAALRGRCEGDGTAADLLTLYAPGTDCFADPRMRRNVVTAEPQIRCWEVHTCPAADLWYNEGLPGLGQIFCEEYQRGLVRGFSAGKGQLNLTKKLTVRRTNGTRPDNHCCFSAYLRAANMDDAQIETAFGPGRTRSAAVPDAAASVKSLTVRTLCYLTDRAEQDFGKEGLCAVSEGLRALVEPTERMLRHYAEMTLSTDLGQFAAQNLPLALDGSDAIWDEYAGGKAKHLFLTVFAGPLRERLGLG